MEARRLPAVIVQDLARLSRDQDGIDGRLIRQCCRENGCVVVTPQHTYDFSTDADDDQADFEFLRAKWYKRDLVKKTMTGMKEAARQGKRLPNFVQVVCDALIILQE